jgi:hypothetical protein
MDQPIQASLDALRRYVESQGFKGHDPYDALNSPVVRALSMKSKYLRIAATQLLRRSPVNIRPLLLTRPGHNPKGLGLFLWGYSRLYRLAHDPACLSHINRLLELLQETASQGYSGLAWGYDFPWQSRAFYLPRYTPTIVNSSFIGHALLDTFAATGMTQCRDMALSIGSFILNDLNKTHYDDMLCFSYTPRDHYCVHNANLLGASLLVRLHSEKASEPFRSAALAALRYSVHHQRADGSWRYSEKEGSHWVDSFHTGFNLQALKYAVAHPDFGCFREALTKGHRYYVDHFFLEDGTPKYYQNRTYPIDIHSAAQAIAYLSGGEEQDLALARTVATWMIGNLQDPDGYFYFRKTPWFINKIPYMRWSQAWAFHALTELVAQTERRLQ